jgi:glycosyltransferase involved in cell wall biosynthesis
MKISIVSPIYKASNILDELVRRISISVETITQDYEIILVEDGCPQNSWEKIEALASDNPQIKGIKLSRNFGQHHAITAGLDHAKGDWVVVMDCDLQDRPEEIPKLYHKALEDFDIVFARRVVRQDGFFKKLSSKLFYKAFSYLSGIEQDGTIGNFGIYSKNVINAINTMREPMRAFLPMAKWVGFNKTSVDVEHRERFEGKTSYNWNKLMNLALDIALAYSDKPLKLTVKLGFTLSFFSIIFALISVIRFYTGDITMSGYTSLIVSIWFLSGLLVFILGIVGLYISKIFDSVKARPLYIISKQINK